MTHLIPDTVLPPSPPGWDMWQPGNCLGEDYSVVSVIGDGSLTGGMAYEALNNASHLKSNFIIVLNDNNMSISENVGGMSQISERAADSAGIHRAEKRTWKIL